MLVVILSSLSVQAWAGEKGNRQGKHMDPERRARMQERLGLTEVQMEQMREIRQNGGSREDMRAVLTDEQIGILDEMRANRKGQGQNRGQGKGRRGPPPETIEESDDAENG